MLEAIPAGGITLANTGLTANTTYLIYYAGGALSASVTAHATDTDTGIEVLSGDVSKTLVGLIRTGAGVPGVFQAAPLTLTFFNRRSLSQRTTFAADRSTASTTYVELNTEIENNFLTWADEDVFAAIDGSSINAAAGTGTGVGLDSATVATAGLESAYNSAAGNTIAGSIGIAGFISGLAEGFHFATVLGKVNSGTGTWHSSTTSGTGSTTAKVYLHIMVRG